MKFKYTLFILLTGLLLASCTVQKRVHRKGWYVQWHFNKTDSGKQSDDAIPQGNESKTVNSEKLNNSSIDEDEAPSNLAIAEENQTQKKTEIKDSAQENAQNKNEVRPNEETTRTDSSSRNKEYIPGIVAPIMTAGVSLLAIIFILAYIGSSPILVSLIISLIISLITILLIRENWKKYPEANARTRIRKNIIWMSVLILAALGFSWLLLTPAIPAWITVAVALLMLFVLLIIGSRKQYKKDKLNEQSPPLPKEKITDIPEKAQSKTTVVRPLRKSEAFPSLVGGVAIFFVLFIVLGLAILFGSWIASFLGGFVMGPLFLLALGVLALLFISAIALLIGLEINYRNYLEDFRQEHYGSTDSATNGGQLKNDGDSKLDLSEEIAAKNKMAIAVGILLTAIVILIFLLMLI